MDQDQSEFRELIEPMLQGLGAILMQDERWVRNFYLAHRNYIQHEYERGHGESWAEHIANSDPDDPNSYASMERKWGNLTIADFDY